MSETSSNDGVEDNMSLASEEGDEIDALECIMQKLDFATSFQENRQLVAIDETCNTPNLIN